MVAVAVVVVVVVWWGGMKLKNHVHAPRVELDKAFNW